MKKFLVILLVLAFASFRYRKPKSKVENTDEVKIHETKFLFKRIKTTDIVAIEKENLGIRDNRPTSTYLSKSYFPEIEKYDFAQPIIYQRSKGNMYTEISYFFTKNDSVVRLIEYSWENYPTSNIQKSFIDDLYALNNSNISKTISLKSKEGNEKFDSDWRKDKTWENDSINIYSFVLGSGNTGYRTRVIIRQK